MSPVHKTIKSRALEFAKDQIMRSSDWQEVQNALCNHPEFGPWLGEEFADYQKIIREAEYALGAKIPSGYSD